MVMSIRTFLGRESKPTETPQESPQQAPPAQPDAVAEAGQKLATLRESFGAVATKLGQIEQETKSATEALRTAKGVSEGERKKIYRSHAPEAAPTERLIEVGAEIARLEQKIRKLQTELNPIKVILPPEIVTTREALAEADAADRKDFSSHLGRAFEAVKRLEDRAAQFEKLTSRYGSLVQHYKFQSLDDANYASTNRPPYTGAPTWRIAFTKWRREHPALEEAPARRWLNCLKPLVEMAEKLQR